MSLIFSYIVFTALLWRAARKSNCLLKYCTHLRRGVPPTRKSQILDSCICFEFRSHSQQLRFAETTDRGEQVNIPSEILSLWHLGALFLPVQMETTQEAHCWLPSTGSCSECCWISFPCFTCTVRASLASCLACPQPL